MNTELLKTILEFVSKSLYPLLFGVLIFLLYPKIQEVDLKALTGRLQSAKVGGNEFTFGEAEKVGAETAPLNRKVAELALQVQSLQVQMTQGSGAGRSPVPVGETPGSSTQTPEVPKAEALAKLQSRWQDFKVNGAYTALVFHDASSRDDAAKVTQMLLAAGYTSSDTETDFSELQKVQPKDGTVFITYTKHGAKAVDEVKRRILALGVTQEVKVNPRAIELKRGDLQVLVF